MTGLAMVAMSAVLFSVMSLLVNVVASRGFPTFQVTLLRFVVQTAGSALFAIKQVGWNPLRWSTPDKYKFLLARGLLGSIAVRITLV